MNIFQVLCAVSPPQNESPNASNFMCIVPTLVITSELEYSSHLVYSVVSPVQLVSSSVALQAKLVSQNVRKRIFLQRWQKVSCSSLPNVIVS